MNIQMRFLASAACVPASLALAAGTAEVEAARAALLKVDAEFSQAAQTLGIAEAFVRYADPSATMLPAGENAITGHEAVRKQFADLPAGSTLVWKPYQADAATSGDLGYTLGTYELRTTDKDGKPVVRYGKYCSVWKKQKDGGWKWVVDVGTPSPPPK
jgi:ketosteroid isomerase-like protein